MRHLLSIATLLSLASSGCYLGNTASQKHTSVRVNGALMVAGAAAIALAPSAAGINNCDDERWCAENGAVGVALLGAGLIAGGLVGLVINTSTDTVVNPDPEATSETASVTAPGLKPAVITLRPTRDVAVAR